MRACYPSDAGRGFSRESALTAVITRGTPLVYCQPSATSVSSGHACGIQRTIPSVRTHVAPPSPLPLGAAGLRIIDRMSIRMTYQACVRSRLTLNRLALFRNPWSFGEGVSLPLCRYLYLHLLFRHLQRPSRDTFAGRGMLPYQSPFLAIPRLRHRTYARLLSMRGRSTSELLRTL